jgi:uncharacterized membrane protein
MFLNLLLLMAVSLAPFPTALVGEWVTDENEAHVVGVVYGAIFLCMGLAFGAIWIYAARRGDILAEALAPARLRASMVRFTGGNLIYLLGIVVAFYSGLLSLALYALVALYYVLPALPARARAE